MEKRGVILLGVFVLIFSLSGVLAWADNTSSYQEVDGCNLLNTTGASYTLTGNVTSTGHCFSIGSQNITLDCNGNWITYSTGGTANTYGINTTQFNTTIKNCNILDGNWGSSQTTRYGIYFNGSNNSILFNSSVNTNKSHAVYLYNGANFNNLSSITANSNTNRGIYLYYGSNNILSNITATSKTSYGIHLYYGSNNILSNITAISNSSYGLSIYSISNNTLNNIVASSDFGGDLLFHALSASYCNNTFNNVTDKDGKSIMYLNEISSNIDTLDISLLIMCNINFSNITNSSFTRGGIYMYHSNNNLLSDVDTISRVGSGIYFHSSSNNIFSNITARSLGNGNGIYLTIGSNFNTFSNITATSNTNSPLTIGDTCNFNTLSNLNATSNTGSGIGISGDNNILSNFTVTALGNLNYGSISLQYCSNNTLSNFISTSNTSNGIYIRSSSKNILNNFTATSNTDYGIYFYESSNNIFSNITASSNTNYGIYVYYSSNNNTLSNITAISNTNRAIYLQYRSSNNTIINSTFTSLNKNENLVTLSSDCNSNRFYWNNFTDTSGYYVADYNGSNYYNTTINGKGEGNIWHNVMNGSVNIKGNISSTLNPSLYIGEYGTDYPYNSTNSFGKLSGNVVDYAPLTNKFEEYISPYFTLIPENSSLFYGNESLLVQFTAEDETEFQGYSVNDTRFSINQSGFLSNIIALAIGYYTINITISDVSGNINWTIYTVQVNKSNYYDCGVYFNTTSPINYPENLIAYTNCSSAYTLYLNGTSISNSTTINSGVGYYNFTVQRTDTANYTYITDTQFFTVNQNTEKCQVLFNATSPMYNNQTFLVWANCSSYFVLLRNGSVIENNSEQSLSVGAYNFSMLRNDTVNYTRIYNETQFIITLTPDTTSPTYSSVAHSSTYAGHVSTFSIQIDDETALNPNGQYIFSTNNSGNWTNDTAGGFASTPSWANVTKTLNSSVGTVVSYMWFFNDDNGNLNSTSIYRLTTTQAPVVDPPRGGGGGTPTQTQYQLGREFSEYGESLKLRKNYQLGFRHQEQSHSLTLDRFDSLSARVTIRSDPITVTLEKDVAQSFDLEGDSDVDIEITYQGTSGSEAQFFVKKLVLVSGESEVFVNSEGGEVKETGTSQISTNELFGNSGSGSESVEVVKREKTNKPKNPLRTVLISLIIMGAIIVGLAVIGKQEKKKKEQYLGFFDK